MRDRDDFIANLQEVYTHLLILTEDIKYPLSEERQTWLDSATLLIRHLHHEILKEDIEAALRAMSEQPLDYAQGEDANEREADTV